MRLLVYLVCGALSCLATANPAYAQVPSNASRGHRLASQLCATCHITGIAPADVITTDVPSLSAIAKRSGMTLETVAGKIIVPHPAMPGVPLTADEIRDLAAYIVSLAPEPR
jgi:mono/diheme cytochrome c family protein